MSQETGLSVTSRESAVWLSLQRLSPPFTQPNQNQWLNDPKPVIEGGGKKHTPSKTIKCLSANAAPFCVTVCLRIRMCVCEYVWVCSSWLGGTKHIDILSFFFTCLLHSSSSSTWPALEPAGVGRPRACCESAVPVLISSRFISLGHDQIKTLTHLLSTIYKCLPGACGIFGRGCATPSGLVPWCKSTFSG